jgi:hypothetical protein
LAAAAAAALTTAGFHCLCLFDVLRFEPNFGVGNSADQSRVKTNKDH